MVSRRSDLFYRFCHSPSHWAAVLTMGLFAEGRDRVPSTGFVLAANHQSYLDPWLLGIACPRILRYLGRRTLFRNPAFRALVSRLGAIPLGSETSDREGVGGLRAAIEALRAGYGVVLFPEGTRSRDGTVAPFKPGAIALAEKAGVPILPACVDGSLRAWPRGRVVPRPTSVRVAFGDPVEPSALGPDPAASLRERVVRILAGERRRA